MEALRLWSMLSEYPNVVGVSNKLMPRIKRGREDPGELCLRVYVSRKLPVDQLRPHEVIPREVGGVPTDVVEIGEVRALSVDKRARFRPLVAGVSIGSIEVTAGTLGWFFEDKRGELLLGSNAHVFVGDPRLRPEEVKVRDIVQPGRHDGGTLDDRVAVYVWHERIAPWLAPSQCLVARAIAWVYNTLAELTGAKTRLRAVVEAVNTVDFAVAKPLVDVEKRAVDMDVTGRLAGLGFAGSDTVSLVCKSSRIAGLGYKPVDAAPVDAREGDRVVKTGRTSCVTRGRVLDSSATIAVGFGGWSALFTDVVLTTRILEPGDSGSSVWLEG
ncbi:MAG: hypothetical protein QXS85_04105 [Acidilobaceae archaeon]